MCGLTGFFDSNVFNAEQAADLARRMADKLVHRGPDDAGEWLDAAAGIALAHRRLSIIDTTAAGHQPMVSVSGRYVLVFNGEIYNHLELRCTLRDTVQHELSWRGHSDTETLLSAIETWGLERSLRKSVGMFSIALWDRQERMLLLARDRMGEKPLYYGWQDDTFLFGSELKSLRVHPAFRAEIDCSVLPLYLRLGYIPAPWSIWKGIRKLIPGTVLRLAAPKPGVLPEPFPYWSLANAVAAGQTDLFTGSDKEAIAALESQLYEVVAGQMMADVPLGAFLSGGIDSSTVVALMQAQSSRPVKTFTIGFSEADYNEAEHAKAVAKHLGTDHTELYVTPEQARAVIPSLPTIYDEPFGDSSAIPTFLVSQMAHQQVTVSLSGDGGDESFGGYPHYASNAAKWRTNRRIPRPLRTAFGASLQWLLPELTMPRPGSSARSWAGRHLVSRLCRLRNLGHQLRCTDLAEFFDYRRAVWRESACLIDQPVPQLAHGTGGQPISANTKDAVSQMMQLEATRYLPDDIMVKVDRASMAVSLESRAPLLDHRVIELAWRLPLPYKFRDGQGKWVLRQILYRHVPLGLVDRTKTGFGVPINAWLRGPLRGWAEDQLEESRINQQDLFDAGVVRAFWRQFLEGRLDYGYQFWVLLMFQAWMDRSQ